MSLFSSARSLFANTRPLIILPPRPRQRSDEDFRDILSVPTPARTFSPITMMLIGRRGEGKSYTLTAIAGAMKAKHRLRKTGFKLASNLWLREADYSSQYIMDDITEFPKWAKDLYLCIDEIQSAALNRRSMAKGAINISMFLHMIRKLRIEPLFTCQFPQQVDQAVLLQTDLVAETRSTVGKHSGICAGDHTCRHHIKLYIHDFWNQWVGWDDDGMGRWGRKRMPPPRSRADWVLPIYVPNPQSLYAKYHTGEVMASSYLPDGIREMIVRDQTEGRGHRHTTPEYEDRNAPVMSEIRPVTETERAEAVDEDDQPDFYQRLLDRIAPIAYNRASFPLKTLVAYTPNETDAERKAALRAKGFTVAVERGSWMVTRP